MNAAEPAVRPSRVVGVPVLLIAALALLGAGAGLFWGGGDGPATFRTLRGETVDLYGWGLYRLDTRFVGAGNRGTDAVTLVFGVPLLLVAAWRYGRGSLRGAFLLLGALGWFLYVYSSYALGAASYNELFLVYVALFSASLFAFALTLRSVDPGSVSAPAWCLLPRAGPAALLVGSGLFTLAVWLAAPLAALAPGGPPAGLGSYSTLLTTALDLGVVVLATLVAGGLIWRREALGYLLGFALLVLEAFLAPMIAAQTASQLLAGVAFTTAEVAGPVAGFGVLALVAVRMAAGIYRGLPGAAASGSSSRRPGRRKGPAWQAAGKS